MTSSNWDIPAGTLICFSTGEYSDYGYAGHFVTLQAITPSDALLVKEEVDVQVAKKKKELEEYMINRTGEYPGYVNAHERFIAGLIKLGFLATVNVHEIHIGSYGDLDIS